MYIMERKLLGFVCEFGGKRRGRVLEKKEILMGGF